MNDVHTCMNELNVSARGVTSKHVAFDGSNAKNEVNGNK